MGRDFEARNLQPLIAHCFQISGTRLCGRDGRNVLIRECLEDGRLASVIEPEDENACL